MFSTALQVQRKRVPIAFQDIFFGWRQIDAVAETYDYKNVARTASRRFNKYNSQQKAMPVSIILFTTVLKQINY